MGGDERESQKAKQKQGDDVAKQKRAADLRAEDAASDAADTSHADRQLDMRLNGKQTNGTNFTDDSGPDHDFDDTGANQKTLWPEVEAILKGKANAKDLAAKVADLDRDGRDKVALRMDEVAKVATCADTLQIGDLVGLPRARTVRAALDAPLDLGALHAHIAAMASSDLIDLFDAATRAKVAKLKIAPVTLVPQLGGMDKTLAASSALIGWYITSTPAAAVARAMLRVDAETARTLSATLNELGRDAWNWVFAASDDLVASAPSANIHLDFTPAFADVTAALKAKTPAHEYASQKGTAPGGAKALEGLVPAGAVDVAALTKAVGAAVTFEHSGVNALTKSPFRERLIAATSIEQLMTLLEYMFIVDGEQLDWLLDSPLVTANDILALSATWSPGGIGRELESPKVLAKLAKRFPTSGPADLFGANRAGIYEIAQTNKAVRAWCVATAQPIDLLHIITFALPTTSKMWNLMVAEGLSPTWFHKLGIGDKGDARLRSLALNCPDPTAAEWIRTHLVGDHVVKDHFDNSVVDIPAVAHETDAGKRLAEGVTNDQVDGAEVGKRMAELSDAEIAKLRDDPKQLADVIQKLGGHWLTRVLFLVQPPLTFVLRHAPLVDDGIPTYIRSRPSAETAAAFRDDATRAKVLAQIHMPFTLLPALLEPHILAAVAKDSLTLEWLLSNTDARYAITLLGQPDVARAIGPVLSRRHLELIPGEMSLSKAQSESLERIANATTKSEIADSLRQRLDLDLPQREQGDKVEKPADTASDSKKAQLGQDELEIALTHKDLAGALDVVLAKPTNAANVLAVCRERSSTAIELLTKPDPKGRVEKLRAAVRTSPIAVFPDVSWITYLHSDAGRSWLFAEEPASVILAELVADAQLATFVFGKLGNDPTVLAWLDQIPKGSALTARERQHLRHLFDGVTNARLARRLFEIRFVGRVSAGSFEPSELARFWTIFERVPDSHTSQGSITNLNETKHSLPGQFGGGHMHLDDKLVGEGKDNEQYSGNLQLTKAELVAAYGYTDKDIEAHIAATHIKLVTNEKGEERYEIQKEVVKLLDFTVLHEIGHSVDEMLGSHTELVYKLAGWKAYTESDIGALAKDMGGWDRVKPADQKRIEEVWTSWINTRSYASLDTLVGDDHPAMSKTYEGVGIVDFARAKQPPNVETPPVHGHYMVTSMKNQQLYRVPERTRNAAPSPYSLTAPAEFFAECYAEYYYGFTGPGTEDKKGGRLAGWIKSWFDQNIDTLKHLPPK